MVLAILGSLLGISLPYYFKAQSQARRLEIQLRLQSFALTLERYYNYYEAFPDFLNSDEPLLLAEHFPELIKMLSAANLKGQPLSPADRATLNPQCHCFLRLNPQDYNASQTSLRTPQGDDNPIYLKVRQGLNPLQLPPPLEEHTTPHRVIVYTYQNHTLIGSWTVVD